MDQVSTINKVSKNSKKKSRRRKNKNAKSEVINNSFFRIDEVEDKKYVVLKDYNLCSELRNMSEFNSVDSLYDHEPRFLVHELYVKLSPVINNATNSRRRSRSKGLELLIKYLTDNNKEVIDKVKNMVNDGNISYEYLWYLFNKDSKYYVVDSASGSKIGSSVESFGYKQSFFGDYFEIYGNVITSDGQNFQVL